MNDQHTQAQNWNPQNSHSSVTSRNSTDRTVFWFKSQSRTVRRSGAKFRWAIYSLYNLVMEMAEQAKICKKSRPYTYGIVNYGGKARQWPMVLSVKVEKFTGTNTQRPNIICASKSQRRRYNMPNVLQW